MGGSELSVGYLIDNSCHNHTELQENVVGCGIVVGQINELQVVVETV